MPKIRIEVKDKTEGENIQRALDDPATRCFVNIVGALLPLGAANRKRVLSFVNDAMNEGAGRLTIATEGDEHHADATVPLPS